MKQLRKIGLGLILMILLVLNLYVGVYLYAQTQANQNSETAYEKMELFTRTIELIRNNYADKSDTSYGELIENALKGMLNSLDRHSQFMEPESYDAMRDETKGSFGGLGIVISAREGVLTIVSTMDGTPAAKAGLRAEDEIISIDGVSTEGVDIQEAVGMLKGDVETKVVLTIRRGDDEIKEVEIVRDEIEVHSVKRTEMLGDGVGYIRLAKFTKTTADDVKSSIEELQAEDMRALILDLRDNPGGLLDSAVEVADLFLEKDDMIVYTQGREQKQATYRSENDPYLGEGTPMAILVNAGSASGAEIIAGALQDHSRAVLVGEKTFGKGSVQAVFPVKDGSAVRLTVAKYYTPSERVIHERGIEPDIVIPIPPDEWARLRVQQMKSYEENGGETDFPKVGDDDQLDKAKDILSGVLLYKRSRRI